MNGTYLAIVTILFSFPILPRLAEYLVVEAQATEARSHNHQAILHQVTVRCAADRVVAGAICGELVRREAVEVEIGLRVVREAQERPLGK